MTRRLDPCHDAPIEHVSRGEVDHMLADLLRIAGRQLTTLVQTWRTAWNVMSLGYGPSGLDYTPRRRASFGTARPIPASLAPGIPASDLSTAHTTSVRLLAAGVVAASELSWVDDNVAQVSVLPRAMSHVPHRAAMDMAKEVDLALIGARWRLAGPHWQYPVIRTPDGPQRQWVMRRWISPPPLPTADEPFLRTICESIDKSLSAMPEDLHVEPATRLVQPTHRECPGYVFHTCGRTIAWTAKRCDRCQTAADRIRQLSHGDHDGTCRNPWGRDKCKSTVTNQKLGLCSSCDQYRRDGRRAA